MTKKEALQIIELHHYHSDKLAEANKEHDHDEIAIHQRAIEQMERDYEKANKLLERLQG